MPETFLLTEGETLEILSFLITAARTQLDEASEYAPMRLLEAAHRLADVVRERASPETRALIDGPLRSVPQTATPGEGRDAYAARLDELCRAVADRLVAHFGLEADDR
jgi:Family of unknown function (DUF6092)